MKPHEQCKKAGLKNLAQLSEISSVSIQTLNNWAKNKPKLFQCVVDGASKKNIEKYIELLTNDSFDSWSDEQKQGYLTACKSIINFIKNNKYFNERK